VNASVTGAAAAAFTLPLVIPTNLAAASPTTIDYNLRQPYSSQSNLTVEQQLPWGTTLQMSYAMTRGIKLYRRAEQNPRIPLGTPVNGTCVNTGKTTFNLSSPYCFLGTEPRINPVWTTSIAQLVADSNSWYHGLQVQLRKRMSRGLQFQSSYTWSKAIDETQGMTDAENAASHYAAANGFSRGMDKGPSSFDIRHNWSFNALYALPRANMTGFAGGMLNGWRLGGIVRMRSGLPFSPALGANRSNSGTLNGPGGLDRPDYLPGANAADITSGTSHSYDGKACATAGAQLGTPNLWFDPCAFGLPAAGFFGNAGRNSMRGPSLSNVDFSITKDTPLRMLGEAGRLEFRMETFNLFNHASFATPEVGVADSPNAAVIFPGNATVTRLSSAGVIQRTSTLSRQIQFALKILF
jgi:hypothetical protein